MSGINGAQMPLSKRQQAALLWMASAVPEVREAEVLSAQSRVALTRSKQPTLVDLVVPSDVMRSRLPDGPLPVRAVAYDQSGDAVGELLVWISDGRLSLLEYAWYTDDPPTEIPNIDRFRIV